MTELKMPMERRFGWKLKQNSSTHFGIHQKPNGQFCVVLNHSLIQGCTSEMIHWWFLNFPNLRVKLKDIEGYENTSVQGYLLWHPSDHHSVSLHGNLGSGNTAQPGAKIHIRESMQYTKYGWKYPVDNKLKIFYCEPDGWAMGKEIPIFGKAMVLRIHYKDIYQGSRIVGVHYHYEIVIGVGGENPIAKIINKKISSNFSPEFFEAWQLHNAIEVGTFENFLPALYQQRNKLDSLVFSKSMNCTTDAENNLTGYDKALFEERLKGYQNASNAHQYQGYMDSSFLK
ncbi:MAG: hypothetical protein AAF518_23285 [Spirochaetota bacterium]